MQGGALSLRQCRHGRVGGVSQESAGPAVPHHLHRRRVLDGRQCRAARQNLRTGREIRRAGDGRRMPFGRRAGQNGPRNHGAVQPARQGGYSDGYAGQGVRRRSGRLHDGPPGDYRHAAPAFAPLSVLEFAAPCRGGRRNRDVPDAERERRTARPARGQCGTLPHEDDGGRVRHQADAVGDLCGHALRCQAVAGFCGEIAGRGGLRDGILLPCRA